MEDNDCGRLNVNVDIQDPSFFVNNPNFIVPSPPDVVIPSIPPIFPADITNAWISPQNPDYCLWFGPFEKYDFIKDGKVVFTDNTFILGDGSFELSACGNNNLIYHNNPFFGIVDYENDYIEITIDRSAKKGKTTLLRENFVPIFRDSGEESSSGETSDSSTRSSERRSRGPSGWVPGATAVQIYGGSGPQSSHDRAHLVSGGYGTGGLLGLSNRQVMRQSEPVVRRALIQPR